MRPSLGQYAPASRQLLRARLVLSMAEPPVENGAVLIGGGQVIRAGSWPELSSESSERVQDLGDVVLLPGLINAHCHLDYTDLAGLIPPPKSFSDWITSMLALKAHQGYSDYAASWLRGARMLLLRGTTTVADIESVPELLPEVSSATPLRVCSLLELTGVRSRRRPAELLRRTLETISTLASRTCWLGISPHAPYSTTPELLRLAGLMARERGWLLATHVAESAEEFEMYTSRRGPMFAWLADQRDMSDCGQGSPLQYLHRQGLLGENFLAIHANYLAAGDAELLGRSGAHVVHCPRSHAYFGHAPFPRRDLERAGVNICLGTDSLATVRRTSRAKVELDLFAEMRTLSDRDSGLSSEAVVRTVTINAARALGRNGQLGQLSPGAHADVIAIPFSDRTPDPYELVVRHAGPVPGVMIGGHWTIPPSPA